MILKIYKVLPAISLFFVPFFFVFAQTVPPDNRLGNPIKYGDLEEFLLAIVNVVIQYGAILIVLFLVIAGFMFVTAQGNTEKISTARKMLVWIVVGAFVLLGVYVIRHAICGTLNQLKAPGTTNLCNVGNTVTAPGGNK